jgi:hypothetical protein
LDGARLTQHLKEEEESSLGADLWPIGLANNLCNIELFIDYMIEQGLISETISPADLFTGE